MYMHYTHIHTNYIRPYPHTQYAHRHLSNTVFLKVCLSPQINITSITQEKPVSNTDLGLVPISKRKKKKAQQGLGIELW